LTPISFSQKFELVRVGEVPHRHAEHDAVRLLEAYCQLLDFVPDGGLGSVRAGIGTRLARRLALPECLRGARAKCITNDRDRVNASIQSMMACESGNFFDYQGRASPRWKYPPVGPSSARVASSTLVLPPSETSSGAADPPISVFTQPG
jgi:hypothetical protein